MTKHPGHVVCVVGGAVCGAEAAHQLALRGVHTILFEQNKLPYGKIEDGLPMWHAKLRDREEARIDEKLSNPYIRFVPGIKIGQDISFDDLMKKWGFSAVLLATGAWRDRPLPVEGIDRLLGKGFYYQNTFFKWYNHKHEGNEEENIEIKDGAIVVGGGLASVDVCKAIMMELVEKALKEHGITTTMFDLERGVIPYLEKHKLTLKDLGIRGCTLVYRRRDKDMPLSPMPTDTPEQLAKAQMVRAKVLSNAMNKFGFHFVGFHSPVGYEDEDGHLSGLIIRKNEVVDGKVLAIKGSEQLLPTTMVVSSIGSLPEPIPGLPYDGRNFEFADMKMCRIKGYDNVFVLGNAVTGRGNIKDSFRQGHDVSQKMMDDFLNWKEMDFKKLLESKTSGISKDTDHLMGVITSKNLQSLERIHEMDDCVAKLHTDSGYVDYPSWIAAHRPKRLEELVGDSTDQ